MKFILVITLLLSTAAVGQSANPVPMKGANRIIIHNEKTAEENYRLIIPALLDQGFLIDKRDNEYHTVQTQNRLIKKKGVNVTLNFIARDSNVIVTGMRIPTVIANQGSVAINPAPDDIDFSGMKGSDFRNAFEAMREAASIVPGRMTFEKK